MTRLFALAVILTLAPAAHADKVRSWTDRDGVVHFSNVHSGKKAPRYVATENGSVKVMLEGHDPAVPSGAGPAKESHDFDQNLREACARYNIPVALARAIMAAESNFNPSALSHAGAVGLMQLLPTTAVDMYVDDAWEPRENIHGGVRYLRVLTNEFQGDLYKVIAAYNAGPDAVKKAGGVPDIPETRTYLQRVLRFYQQFQQQGG